MVPLEAPNPGVYIDTFIFLLRSLCKIIWRNVHYFPNAPRITTKRFIFINISSYNLIYWHLFNWLITLHLFRTEAYRYLILLCYNSIYWQKYIFLYWYITTKRFIFINISSYNLIYWHLFTYTLPYLAEQIILITVTCICLFIFQVVELSHFIVITLYYQGYCRRHVLLDKSGVIHTYVCLFRYPLCYTYKYQNLIWSINCTSQEINFIIPDILIFLSDKKSTWKILFWQ